MQTIAAPSLSHASASHDRSPFHPYRPLTPTARCLAVDSSRSSRFRKPPGRFIHARSTMQKTLGQLLEQEWKIDEVDENLQSLAQESSRLELVHRKLMWPTSCHGQLPEMSALSFAPTIDLGLGSCRSWSGRRKSSLNEVSTVFVGVSDMRENMSR